MKTFLFYFTMLWATIATLSLQGAQLVTDTSSTAKESTPLPTYDSFPTPPIVESPSITPQFAEEGSWLFIDSQTHEAYAAPSPKSAVPSPPNLGFINDHFALKTPAPLLTKLQFEEEKKKIDQKQSSLAQQVATLQEQLTSLKTALTSKNAVIDAQNKKIEAQEKSFHKKIEDFEKKVTHITDTYQLEVNTLKEKLDHKENNMQNQVHVLQKKLSEVNKKYQNQKISFTKRLKIKDKEITKQQQLLKQSTYITDTYQPKSGLGKKKQFTKTVVQQKKHKKRKKK